MSDCFYPSIRLIGEEVATTSGSHSIIDNHTNLSSTTQQQPFKKPAWNIRCNQIQSQPTRGEEIEELLPRITAIAEKVDKSIGNAGFLGHLEQRKQMPNMRMNSAV